MRLTRLEVEAQIKLYTAAQRAAELRGDHASAIECGARLRALADLHRSFLPTQP